MFPNHDSEPVVASYHAHIYYQSPAERAAARAVREAIDERFEVQLGSWHDVPVGPHAAPMYQVAFDAAQFARFVPWLMLNRRGLTVLVHPMSGAPRADHLQNALWMGAVLPIMNPERLPEQRVLGPSDAIFPNTRVSVRADVNTGGAP